VHFAREQAYEGKYVIQTEEPELSPVEAVQAYKELSEVERAFRELKDVIELRPIYHRRKERVQAHIFVAALAFLLDRALEKKLKAARVAMSAADALKALRTVHVVDLVVGPTRKRGVTGGSARARQVLSSAGMRGVPDSPPERAAGPPARASKAGHIPEPLVPSSTPPGAAQHSPLNGDPPSGVLLGGPAAPSRA
jgi:hypothetical protein